MCLNSLVALRKKKKTTRTYTGYQRRTSPVYRPPANDYIALTYKVEKKIAIPTIQKQYDMKQTLPSNLPQPSLLPFPKPTSAPLPLFQHQLDHHPRPLQRILLAPEPIQSSPAMPRTRSIEPHVRPCLRKLQRQRVQRDFRDGVRDAGGGREGAGGDGVERGAGGGDVHDAGRG